MYSAPNTRNRSQGSVRIAQTRVRLSRAGKAEKIAAILEAFYPEPAIPLRHEDPFTLLVSVVLSAQTTDKKVNQVTPGLFALAGTPAKMAACSLEQIRTAIREVGLAPQKARALKMTAQMLVERHGGRVPATFEALVELPGVGRKTANVVLAQAFDQQAFPVDTHIHRLAGRWGLSRAKNADGTEVDLCRIFPRALWSKLHLQMIYFGREHCPALRHDLTTCPICAWAASKARIRDEMRSLSKASKASKVSKDTP
ncbi:MAG: endonuclease III [Deltaproteobacteria bacterium]|nr:endonuclease III [Deltaproteobacteria bacterium]